MAYDRGCMKQKYMTVEQFFIWTSIIAMPALKYYITKLRGHPIAVGGDVETRHGIILAKDYIAKEYGIKVGQALWEARQLCPNLIIVLPYCKLYLNVRDLLRISFRSLSD